MDDYSKEQFKYSKGEIIFYGTLFIKSEGGFNWENLWKGSSISTTEPNWLHFYYNLKTHRFRYSIKNLLDYKTGDFQKETIIQEIKDLVEEVKGIKPIISKSPSLRTHVSIEPAVLKKNEEAIKFLFDKDVIYNFPWAERERNDIIIFRPINEDFKEILLDGYYSIINHYENEDRQRVNELQEQVQVLNNAIQSLNNEKQIKHEALKNKTIDLEVSNKILKNENQELIENIIDQKKGMEDVIQELRAENREIKLRKGVHDDINLPKDISFRMVFLWRLGFLEPSLWPDSNLKKIGKLISMFLTSKGEDIIPISAATIIRYRNALINYNENSTKNDSKALDLIQQNDEKVIEAIKKAYDTFDPRAQKHLLNLENKDKTKK